MIARAILAGVVVLGLAGGFLVGSRVADSDAPTAAGENETSDPTVADSPSTTGPSPSTGPDRTVVTPSCEIPVGTAFDEAASVELTELGTVGEVRVDGALYPRPEYTGELWSQWGQGIALDDGRFYSAIGDHVGADGNSFIYEYDPATNTLAQVSDVLSHVDHVPGTWGFGKVHAQMVEGACGEIYLSTYWGTVRNLAFEGNYRGDYLFRLDPFARTIQPLDVPVEFHGQASMAGASEFGLVYGEAVDPILRDDDVEVGPFFAYDVIEEEVVFTGPESPHTGFRSILVDGPGRAYYSIGGGQLAVYDPATGELGTHGEQMPGDWLRAATSVAPDGSVYGVTREPDVFFEMSADGSIRELGEAAGYTTSMALSPDGEYFYYMPDAHGGAWEQGAPLIRVSTADGSQETIAELNPLVEESFGLRAGGTYNIAMSPDGESLYLGVNASEDDTGFGEIVLLVVHLP